MSVGGIELGTESDDGGVLKERGVPKFEIVVDGEVDVVVSVVSESVPNMETAKTWSLFCAAKWTLSQRL